MHAWKFLVEKTTKTMIWGFYGFMREKSVWQVQVNNDRLSRSGVNSGCFDM